MQYDENGHGDYKFQVFCFVADTQHGDKFAECAACRTEQKERALRDTPLLFLCAALIGNGQDCGCDIDDTIIDQQCELHGFQFKIHHIFLACLILMIILPQIRLAVKGTQRERKKRMIVIKKYHYVIAVLILVAAVFLAMKSAAGREENAEPRAAENSVEVVFPSTAPEQEDSNAAETNAKAEEPLVGVWIPYMALDVTEKTEEAFKENFDAKLAAAKSVGTNAVFVHVRPFADSLYPSEYESWSHLLTDMQGKDPGYDPMEYMVNAAHEQNMQFHAWINPLRIASTTIPPELDENGFYMQNYVNHPEYFMAYNSGIYYNPASAYIRNRIADGAAEIAEKYDVDGIHFDDYFYPTDDESIDAEQYAAYVNETEEPLTLHEWRTANVNALIAAVYSRVKEANENVQFGISPQGNLENNEMINADVYTWCAQAGYIDYVCPQLYYSFENEALPFETALQNWCALKRLPSIKLYIGLAVYKAGTDADNGTWLNTTDTLAKQIDRAKEAGADGVVLYAVDHLTGENAKAEMANAVPELERFKEAQQN